jgi:hypothetical protein
MLAIGANLETSAFAWPDIETTGGRFSGVLYQIYRNPLDHADLLPGDSTVLEREFDDRRHAIIGPDRIALPDTIIYALLAVTVFAKVNAGETTGDSGCWIGHGGHRFPVDEWWGREDDVREHFAQLLVPRETWFSVSRPNRESPSSRSNAPSGLGASCYPTGSHPLPGYLVRVRPILGAEDAYVAPALARLEE